jgi:hypothetical protein
MQEVIKYTYLMEPEKVEQHLERLWARYQHILENPNWIDLNEARGILYFLGHLFSEYIALQALSRRLPLLKEPLELPHFLHLVDSGSPDLDFHRHDPLFRKLEHFYGLVRKFKNKHVGGKFYLDEERFIQKYNEFARSASEKISYKGEKPT